MIKFIEGSAVFDVSGKMREMLCDSLSDGSDRSILIVPDQFEFETEKTIYSDLSKKGLLTKLSRISVTTFSSLSREILLSAGENMPAADDIVKSVVMNKAVREQKNTLSALRGAADKTGFCERMIDTVNALKTAGIAADDLGEESGLFAAGDEKNGINSLVKKLYDVGKIYESYENMLSKYADSLDYTKKAAELISRSDNVFFENTWVFVDCFNDFTGSQMEFIRRMTAKAKNVVFAFVADTKDAPRENIFGRILAQRDRIRGYAENENISAEIESQELSKRLCGPLGELSEKIFENTVSDADPFGACELVSARDAYGEADYTAAKIKQLCLDKGMLYRETAVLCADAEYGKYMRDAFEKYEIPFFLDIPDPILYQPLVNFFISLLNTLRNFTADNVLSCLKTGFYSKPNADETDITAISSKDIDVFENYIFEWNLSAKHIKKEFKFADENNFNQLEAEKIRKAVAVPIIQLREEIKNKDGAQITRALYDFAENKVGIERALRARCFGDKGGDISDGEALRVNQQIWNSLVGIFEVLEGELSGENISLDEYYRLFTEICANTTLAKPPQYRDCVLVGDIDRTRVGSVKAVFIVGASYERLPAASNGMGIFSDYEAELFTSLVRKNTDSDDIRARSLKDFKEQYSLSLYRAYRAVSLPTELLSISCPEYDASGNKISRSTIFSDIRRVFPKIEIIRAENLGDEFYCRSVKAVKQRYSMKLNDASPSARAMRDYLENNSHADFVQKLDEIHDSRGGGNSYAHRLSENTAKQLFRLSHEKQNSRLSMGATQVEKLVKCPFSYFCTGELGIREITKREFNSSNRGSAMHYVMQKVFERYKDKMNEFFRLEREDFLSLANQYLTEFLKTNTNGDFEDDKRTVFLFKNIASSAADLLITMQTELSVRSYRPQLFELNISNETTNEILFDTDEFNGNLPNEEKTSQAEGNTEKANSFELLSKPLSLKLEDGTEVLVGGYLDRLDVMYAEKDNKPRLYLRVIDYKSSARSFDKENAKNGANIQMLLYLTALCDANSNSTAIDVLPGEISYIPSKNAGAAQTKLEAFYLLEMNHHPNGLYVNDEFVKNNLKNITEKIAENITDVDEDKKRELIEKINGSFELNGENSATPEEFKALAEECVGTITAKLEKIYGGDVSAMPLIYEEKTMTIDDSADSESAVKTVKKEQNPCKYCDFGAICGNPQI
ncbi:MAG: PD-(D/E)XK nuclease family protein [Oscillospiraceae bacterium]|nr:PD-(D/E)XK nuclease family protein [Oscillospiraceae bacterium]